MWCTDITDIHADKAPTVHTNKINIKQVTYTKTKLSRQRCLFGEEKKISKYWFLITVFSYVLRFVFYNALLSF